MLRSALIPITRAIRSVVGTNGLAERVADLDRRLIAATNNLPSSLPRVTPSPPSLDVSYLMHDSRGALLRGMPSGAKRLLSAGCAGNWYFEWIEQTYGRVQEHLGIEYYMPKPEGLSDNVTWITNTASDMSGVEDVSCDLVFSGQNLEHLWPEEVSGFLLEGARVLKPGGHLVIDSPNRLLTAPLNWSHPEHTIELTLDEVTALMRLAGFDVTASYGVWLCRDPRTGEVLPFDPNQATPGWSVTERLIVARDRPNDSFIWWVEGVRTDRNPDAEATHAMMADLFNKHWPERVQRLAVPAGRELRQSQEGTWIEAAAGEGGVVMHGPYMPLRAGRYRVTWQIRSVAKKSLIAVCDVVALGQAEPLARCEVQSGETLISLDFDIPDTTFGIEFRCFSIGNAGFSILRKVELEENIERDRRSMVRE